MMREKPKELITEIKQEQGSKSRQGKISWEKNLINHYQDSCQKDNNEAEIAM